MQNTAEPVKKKRSVTGTISSNSCRLILYNDEINTFDFVIQCLIDICNLSEIQAEQLTMLVHHKGKATVKEGSKKALAEMCNQLCEKGLSAEIQ